MSVRPLLILFLVAALAIAGTWIFFDLFEKRWVAIFRPTPAAMENPMLAATRLLEHHRHPVKIEPTLSVALFKPIPAGTLILPDNSASLLAKQAEQLMDWVQQGNTLIMTPTWTRGAAPKLQKKDAAKDGQDGKDDDADPKDGDKARQAKKLPPPTKDPAAAVALASLSERFGVGRTVASVGMTICRNPLRSPDVKSDPDADPDDGKKFTYVDCVASMTLPGAAYALRLDNSHFKLKTLPVGPTAPTDHADDKQGDAGNAGNSQDVTDDADTKIAEPAPAQSNAAPDGTPALFADDDASAVRAYQYGKGRVVIVAENYFNNSTLGNYDHAEFLLGLADLNRRSATVTFIQRVDVASWYRILWAAVPYTIVSLGIFLTLLAWAVARRFGPLVAEPDDRRRALMEHVDASGRWLWKSEHGRIIMLEAARRVTERVLARRAPELRKLTVEQKIAQLAESCKMSVAQIERALLDAPARVPIEFTQQIQSLQQLRKHYER